MIVIVVNLVEMLLPHKIPFVENLYS